jgi:hypothetical protein
MHKKLGSKVNKKTIFSTLFFLSLRHYFSFNSHPIALDRLYTLTNPSLFTNNHRPQLL